MPRRLLALIAAVFTIALPQLASAQNWAGFYIGGNVGYSWGRSDSTISFGNATTGAILSSSDVKFNLNGAIGGGQVGYNWQSQNWVFGFEADVQASGQKGSGGASCAGGTLAGGSVLATLSGTCAPGHVGDTAPFDVAAFPVTSSLSQKLDWFGTVRGRFGPTVTPTLVVYATGGLAFGHVSSTNSISGTNITGTQGTNTFVLTPVFASSSKDVTKVGWTVGAGIEGVIVGNWTGKIEYIYMDLGNVSGAFVTPIVTTTGAFLTSSYRSHITDNILRVGLNYKFGGPTGP